MLCLKGMKKQLDDLQRARCWPQHHLIRRSCWFDSTLYSLEVSDHVVLLRCSPSRCYTALGYVVRSSDNIYNSDNFPNPWVHSRRLNLFNSSLFVQAYATVCKVLKLERRRSIFNTNIDEMNKACSDVASPRYFYLVSFLR
jgi:hypothetical protein